MKITIDKFPCQINFFDQTKCALSTDQLTSSRPVLRAKRAETKFWMLWPFLTVSLGWRAATARYIYRTPEGASWAPLLPPPTPHVHLLTRLIAFSFEKCFKSMKLTAKFLANWSIFIELIDVFQWAADVAFLCSKKDEETIVNQSGGQTVTGTVAAVWNLIFCASRPLGSTDVPEAARVLQFCSKTKLFQQQLQIKLLLERYPFLLLFRLICFGVWADCWNIFWTFWNFFKAQKKKVQRLLVSVTGFFPCSRKEKEIESKVE